MGTATAKGLYLPDKLNLLLRYWAKPLWQAISKRLNPRYAERLNNQLSKLSNTDVDDAKLKLVRDRRSLREGRWGALAGRSLSTAS
jgi:hypothetical protein